MAALRKVPVPDIGDFRDVPVTEILVSVGDRVDIEDPLVALESDKATMEVPSPLAGAVAEVAVKLGDLVSEGTLLVTIDPEDPDQGQSHEPAAAPEAAEGQGPAAAPEPRDGQVPAPAQAAPAAPAPTGRVYAGPVVRRRARELGISLESIPGSGPRGRITGEDLDRAAAHASIGSGTVSSPTPAPRSPAPPPPNGQPSEPPGPGFERHGPVERVPLSRVRRATAANLARSWAEIPHVTQHEQADITDLEDFRRALNAEQSQVKATLLAFLMKACVAALKAHPRLNSSLDGDELVLKGYWHIGFAADTDQGLLVPVLRDVDRKGLLELAGELAELAGRARAGRLTPAEMSGASFTISSLGGIGGTGFTPIINPPEVAILGVSRAALAPRWDGQAFLPRLILPLSLSYDHRVIDGAEAARFCACLAALLADMRRALL